MAEEVEFRIEQMVEEVEELERLGLLSNKEIKKLLEKRREFEYRLVKRIRRRQDYFDYCTYEKKLIELIRIRRQQIGINEKPAKIEYPIAKRNLARLQYVTRVWPTMVDSWTSRIDFAKFMNWKPLVSLVYEDQTRFHGNLIGLWIAWAKYELEERNDFDASRKILLSKAIRHHPKSVQLKRELFRLELLYVEALHLKKNNNLGGLEEIIAENREKVLNCAVAEVVYRDAVKNLSDPELYRQLYMVASKFDFANELREKIFKDFCRNFPKSEKLYKILAIRAASGELDNIDDLEENSTETNCESVKGPEEEVVNNLENISVQEGSSKEDQNAEAMLPDVKTDGTLEVNDNEPALETTNKMKPLEKLKRIIEIFDKALQNVGSTFVNSYMEELLSLLHQSWGLQEMADLVFNKIKEICTKFKDSLSPLNFYVWYHVLKQTTSTPEAQQCVLEDSVKAHPNETHLQLQLVKQMINVATTDNQKLKAFDRYSNTLKGKCGLELWEETIRHVADEELKESLFVRGTKHSNATVGHKMKSDYLKRTWANKGVQEAREVYKTLSWTPPFCMRIHADMIVHELKQNEVDVKRVREMFSNVLLQNGNKTPGVWLAYMQFEKRFGDPLMVGGLGTRAEDELDAKAAQIFRELLLDLGEDLGVAAKETPDGAETVSYVENTQARQEAEKAEQQTLVKLFEEEVSLAYTPNQERIKFFSAISTLKRQLQEGNQEEDAEDSSVWEEVLEVITGQKIVLSICKVKKTPAPKAEVKKKKKKDEYKLRDKLQIEESIDGRTDDFLKKLLESSETLQPEFLKQKALEPYFHDKEFLMKKKMEKKKTKGSGWFAMQQPEMTEELSRDLEILQMRSVLDPSRHYKNKDMAVLPKYFQVGKVVDSAVDFYSSRIPKKARKRTLAEEIMNDEEALRYQKKKYTEIVASKQKRGKRMQQMKKGSTSKKKLN